MMQEAMNSNPFEISDTDDIQAWCRLLRVSENDLYMMSESEIHMLLDNLESKKVTKRLHFNSLYKHLNLKNFKIGRFFKNPLKHAKSDETISWSNISEDEARARGGGINRGMEDSSLLFRILCKAARKLDCNIGKDVFNYYGINPYFTKNSVTELNINSLNEDGDLFIANITFDYDNQRVYFQSKKVSKNHEIETSKEIPLHKNPYYPSENMINKKKQATGDKFEQPENIIYTGQTTNH